MKYLPLLILLTSCGWLKASVTKLHGSKEITCYAGNFIVYRGMATGKVSREGSWISFTDVNGEEWEIRGICKLKKL